MKDFRVTKIVKQIKFEEVWDELDPNKMLPKTTIHEIFETSSSFHVKQRTVGKV